MQVSRKHVVMGLSSCSVEFEGTISTFRHVPMGLIGGSLFCRIILQKTI